VGELGHGGMGVVYDARDEKLGERVAIKVIRPGRASSGASHERFLHEVRLARRIAHPGIVRIFELGEERGAPFVAMERLEGADLGRVLAERGRLPVLEALDCVIQACDALAAAHDEGIVHRDIKPTNLFLTSSGAVKVLDFGLAAATDLDDRDDRAAGGGHQAPRAGAGTPAFMAPEQRWPETYGSPTPATDVWALARVLTELLTGRVDAWGDLAAAAPAMPVVPLGLAQVLSAALADDPTHRPPSAAALGKALRESAARLVPARFSPRRLAWIAAVGALLIVTGATAVETGVRRWWRGEIESALEQRQLSRAAALALAAFPDARGKEPWFRALAATVEDRGHALLRAGRTLEALEALKLARELGASSADGVSRAREAREIEVAARRVAHDTPPSAPLVVPASAPAPAPEPTHTRASLRSEHAAALYLDGQPLGLTPFEGELPLGLHRIRVVDLDSGHARDEIVSLGADTPLERAWTAR